MLFSIPYVTCNKLVDALIGEVVRSSGMWSDRAGNTEEKWQNEQCGLGFWTWIGAFSHGPL